MRLRIVSFAPTSDLVHIRRISPVPPDRPVYNHEIAWTEPCPGVVTIHDHNGSTCVTYAEAHDGQIRPVAINGIPSPGYVDTVHRDDAVDHIRKVVSAYRRAHPDWIAHPLQPGE